MGIGDESLPHTQQVELLGAHACVFELEQPFFSCFILLFFILGRIGWC